MFFERPDQPERPLVKVAGGADPPPRLARGVNPRAWSRTAASEDPPWSQKNCHPAGIFLSGGVGSLDQGAGAQRQRSLSMDSGWALVEMLLAFGIILGFLVFELVSVRRSMRNGEPRRPKDE